MLPDKYGFVYNDEFDGQYFKCETISLDSIAKVITIQTIGELLFDPNVEFIMSICFENKLFLADQVYVQMINSLYHNVPATSNSIGIALVNTYDLLFKTCNEHLNYTDLPNEIKLRMERIKLLES